VRGPARDDTGPIEAPRGPRRWARPLGWILLGAGLLTAVAAMLWRRFYYGNDDLLEFSVARDHGLSWTTLSFNVFQHFGPYNRFGHLLVVHETDLAPLAGLALVLVNVAVLLAVCLWLVTELRLSTARRVVALVMIALSVTMTESAVWFDAGMHILPAIAATLAVCAAHVRGVRTGRIRWHAVALLLFLLGQLTQERPIFALPLVVLVDALLLWRDLPWGERLRRLWKQRWPLASLVGAALAIAAALKAFVVVDDYAAPSWAVTGRTMLSALTNYLVPALANQPMRGPADLGVQLVVLAVILGVGVLLALVRRGNAGPLLFAAATFLLYYGFLKLSPLLNEDTITVNAQRLHNAVYVAVPAIIGLVHLRLPGARLLPRRAAARRALQVTACLGLIGYLVASNVAYLDRRWGDTTEARAYLDTVRSGTAEWSDPDVTLVPLLANPAMATGWSRPYSRHDHLLGLIDKGWRPGDVGPDPVLIDDTGAVRPAALDLVRPRMDVASGGCGARSTSFADDADLYTPRVRGGPLFVQLTYRAERDLDVRLSAGWGSDWDPNALDTHLPAGEHTRLLPVDAGRLEAVDVQILSGPAGLCVESAAIVRPLVVEGGGRCREVDRFGTPGRVRPCP
jgi:hypothetical protein